MVGRMRPTRLRPGAEPWPLVRDDATERQERPIAIGLSEGFPELPEKCRRAALQRALEDWSGRGVSHAHPPC